MKKILLSLLCVGSTVVFADTETKYPCATFIYGGDKHITIENDPNWDDQIVMVNGKKKHNFKVKLYNNQKAVICGTYNEFGLNFYDYKKQFSRADISNLNSSLTNLIEIYPENGINYSIDYQAANFITISIK
ncbi:MAG: hypothetical protein PHC75_09295 [Burkholderiales bacterium]|nr:hypothetical protein [Burkholderiales bacterium]